NPTIGAGMVVAAVETVVRRPKVADFSSLRHDAAQPGGWWRNRVTRILLIFILASLGSAAGTYLAGALIAGRLFG
ncbi:MAG: conjugal transfer protein TraB, partial [Thiohalospira sp.]